MNFQSILTLEKVSFNILMYAIMLIGGLATFFVAIMGMVLDSRIHWFNPYLAAGTISGGALCHYFHHRSASYLNRIGDKDVSEYESALSNHFNNSLVVGVGNVLILLTLIGITIYSIVNIPGGIIFGFYRWFNIIPFALGLVLFIFSKAMAEGGWVEPKDK